MKDGMDYAGELEYLRELDDKSVKCNEQFSKETLDRLDYSLTQIVQGELCEWGNSKKIKDFGEKGIRDVMNQCSNQIIERIESLLASYRNERVIAEDEFGRKTVWIAVEITPSMQEDEVKAWWDEAEAALIQKVNEQALRIEELKREILQLNTLVSRQGIEIMDGLNQIEELVGALETVMSAHRNCERVAAVETARAALAKAGRG